MFEISNTLKRFKRYASFTPEKIKQNPSELIGVMQILKAAAGPNRTPERMSTHPDPENRIEKIKEAIKKYNK